MVGQTSWKAVATEQEYQENDLKALKWIFGKSVQ